MRRYVKAVLSASFYIIFLSILPSLSLWLLPPEIKSYVLLIKDYTGIDVQFMITVALVVGLMLAALSFAKNMTHEWSIMNLIAALLSEAIGFYMSLFLLGLGNPLSMGLAKIPINYGGGATAALDLRFVTLLDAVIMAVSAAKSVVNFYYARRERPV